MPVRFFHLPAYSHLKAHPIRFRHIIEPSMSRIGRVFKSYLFWTHDRGSFHYDVMVTLVLVFIFVGPRYIDFKDQPAEHLGHPTALEITPDGNNGFVCVVDAATLGIQNADVKSEQVRSALLRLVRPVTGEATVTGVDSVRDRQGHVVAYRAQLHK